ncbi:MFS transporter [Levilinea saccharolytica]|uniref:MFS transporter n=1 Tax=Levilinea saccharolytica TaxID=229921 RepID=A0A0P6YC82_9CHLR|nr:MFS transporter [Levilinea saccharolytica]KPL79609.1 MFS transporter [Levilinea saccharolytica]GAP17367.1 arabinose efflux permease [Levilinea saccharolytica]
MASSTALSKNWQRPYFTIWFGQLFSILGSILVQFALIWYLTEKTGSATILAMATLVGFVPEIVLGPFVGALVDRWNRRKVLMISDGSVALVTLGLVVLFWLGIIQTWHILIALFLRSLAGTFHFPTFQASTALMVPDEHLSRISGINQAARGALNIVGPPLGALMLAWLPMHFVLMVDIVTAALAVFTVSLVAIPQPAQSDTSPVTPRSVLADVSVGIRYVRAWPGLMAVILMATFLNFMLTPTGALTPLLITKHFNGGAVELGWIESASGLGVVVGGLLLGVWGGFRKKVVTSLLGIVGLGAGILIVGLAPSALFPLALFGMALTGFMNPITNGPLMALMQARVAPEMQGRVFTLMGAGCSAMVPLSMLLAGPLSDLLGIRTWFWVSGAACMIMGLLAFTIPAIMTMEEQNTAPLVPVSAAASD